MSESNIFDKNITQMNDVDTQNQETQLGEYLHVIQEELKEVSRQQGEIVYLGELKGKTNSDHWTGVISLQKRLDSGELSEDDVKEAQVRIGDSYVDVTKGAPKRCVDGSSIEGYDDNDPEWYGRPLGPQIQGGTNGDASGIRLSKGYEEGATLLSDVNEVIDKFKSDFAPGDHTDIQAEGEKTGCGQIDGHQRRSETYGNEEKSKTLVSVMKWLYSEAGLAFPQDKVDTLLKNGSSLHDNADEYYASGNQAILEAISNGSPKGIETLIRPHNEVFLVINFVKGTTFHRDHFNSLTDDKINSFGLDAWNIIEEHGENAFFVLADAVDTTMDLTDGTIQVLARVPNNN